MIDKTQIQHALTVFEREAARLRTLIASMEKVEFAAFGNYDKPFIEGALRYVALMPFRDSTMNDINFKDIHAREDEIDRWIKGEKT